MEYSIEVNYEISADEEFNYVRGIKGTIYIDNTFVDEEEEMISYIEDLCSRDILKQLQNAGKSRESIMFYNDINILHIHSSTLESIFRGHSFYVCMHRHLD